MTLLNVSLLVLRLRSRFHWWPRGQFLRVSDQIIPDVGQDGRRCKEDVLQRAGGTDTKVSRFTRSDWSSLLDKAIVITAICIHGFDQTKRLKCFTAKTNKDEQTLKHKTTRGQTKYSASRVIVLCYLDVGFSSIHISHGFTGFHGKNHDVQVIFWQRELWI